MNRGDTIKFGRIKFNVKDYKSSKCQKSACKQEAVNSGALEGAPLGCGDGMANDGSAIQDAMLKKLTGTD